MSDQKIKSIKKIKDFPFDWLTNKDGVITEAFLKEVQKYPEFFEIEYEPEKPKPLKRQDGSVISGVPENTSIIKIVQNKYARNQT